MSRIKVMKESGELEDFDRLKVERSLLASGVAKGVAERVIGEVTPRVRPGMTTRQVFRLAKRHLGPLDMPSRMRYSLKEALYALGPSGFPFERFVARMFEAEGYATEVGVEIMGRCVRHEVDVVARRGRETMLVECKFHGQGDLLSNVKTALYVLARRMREQAIRLCPASV